jgi:hypothetical protein
MIRPDDIPSDVAQSLAAVLTGRLDAYKAQYRAMVASKLVEVRDGYDPSGPEYRALEQVLRRIGAAPRNPG